MCNVRKRTPKLLIVACLLAVFAAGTVQAADDALLKMLPEDCLFCVRINDMDASLSKLDAYMTGLSPMPMGMLIKGQLGQMVGDPMLTGINTSGNFAVLGLSEDTIGVLVPMTNFDDFVQNNPNCTKGEDGTAVLSNQAIGQSFVLASVSDGKYAVVVPQMEQAKIAALKTALTSDGSLGKRISAEQAKEAVTAPAWAYIDVAKLYNQYGDLLLDELASAEETLATAAHTEEMGQMADMAQFGIKFYGGLFKAFAGDADSVTVALTPDAGALTLDLSLKAKDGSRIAKMLVAEPGAENDFKLAGYLNNDNAVNALMKMSGPSLEKFYDLLFEVMDSTETNGMKSLDKMKALTRKSMAAMGDEAAISFTYAGEKPPFRFTEVFTVKDMDVMQEMMTESMGLVSDLYAEIGIPMELKFQPETSTYKNATISTMLIGPTKTNTPEDPFAKAMEEIYGGSLTYLMANTDDTCFLAMGEDVENTLKELIDRDASAGATGEVKAAFDLLQDSGFNEFVCSVNIIKLISGWGEMFGSISELHGDAGMPLPLEMFADIKVPTQSSLAIGSKASDGQLTTRIVLPKQHMMEVMTVGMQIQQKVMQQMMQEGAGVPEHPQP